MVKLGLSQRPEVSLLRRSLCRIVNLLANKGDITGYDVHLALKDYYEKHPDGGLAYEVEDLYLKKFNTPGQAVAYWIRSVNQNGIKVAALCLEEQVSESELDALEASLIVISNVLDLYKNSRSLLTQRTETARGKSALEKADKTYELVKSAFAANRDHIKEVFPNENFYISSIEEAIKQLDE